MRDNDIKLDVLSPTSRGQMRDNDSTKNDNIKSDALSPMSKGQIYKEAGTGKIVIQEIVEYRGIEALYSDDAVWESFIHMWKMGFRLRAWKGTLFGVGKIWIAIFLGTSVVLPFLGGFLWNGASVKAAIPGLNQMSNKSSGSGGGSNGSATSPTLEVNYWK